MNAHLDFVELLIDRGCEIGAVNFNEDTSLLLPADNGHMEVMRLLLAAGAKAKSSQRRRPGKYGFG